MKNARKRIARYAVVAGIALAVAAQSLATAVPAHAAGVESPKYFDRKAVMQRAKTWTDASVPYSQTGWLKNYRTDCSGFVSMAWGLDRSYVTWSLPEVAKPIAKEDLQPGDILLQQNHVVLFGGWTDSRHTAYTVYEQVGGGIHRAVKRVIPYPYDSNPGAYKPYRYVGGHNLKAPGNNLPTALMETNAGNGSVGAPNAEAVKVNERIWQQAAERKAQAQQLAKRRMAEKAAAKKAAEKAAAEKARHEAAAKAAAKARAERAKKPAAAQLFDSLMVVLAR